MGFLVDSHKDGGSYGLLGGCVRTLIRRKQVDSVDGNGHEYGHHQLAKELSVLHLIAIGVGSTIGAGVYILVGTVAREHSGPALALSFLIAGFAAALSAFCYAELASRCPSAGSAYHYSYICVGEGVAWLVGWALILEYTIGGSAVARGISPNLALLFGGEGSLPFFLARQTIPGLHIVVDPCAAILVFFVTGLLCVGIKESTVVQGVVTTINVCAMLFIIISGTYLGFKSGWSGYELPTGYFPYGVDGMLAGSATVFFAYIGFDSVASTAEEVKNPQRDLPMGIGFALSICCSLYMLVSIVVVGLMPYYAMDPDTPISSAFASHGMQWAVYIITAGAVMALCSTLMGSLLPQVSVGTLLAFTMVAISVLILRYVPPDEVPVPSCLQQTIDCVSPQCIRKSEGSKRRKNKVQSGTSEDSKLPLLGEKNSLMDYPDLVKLEPPVKCVLSEEKRRKIAGWTIAFTCVGAFVLTFAASNLRIQGLLRYCLCGFGGALLLAGLIVLTCIEQDDARHKFGHSGGFTCPFVPLLPIFCILINTYLLVNLGAATWARVSVWLGIGIVVYVFYGRKNSSLMDAVYVPVAHADEIYGRRRRRSSGDTLA
ncbi:Cationic amino acid transporter 2, vacuolar [Linum perenne]